MIPEMSPDLSYEFTKRFGREYFYDGGKSGYTLSDRDKTILRFFENFILAMNESKNVTITRPVIKKEVVGTQVVYRDVFVDRVVPTPELADIRKFLRECAVFSIREGEPRTAMFINKKMNEKFK